MGLKRFGTAERCWQISQGYAFFAYLWYCDRSAVRNIQTQEPTC